MKRSPSESPENSPENPLQPVPPHRNPKMKKTRDLPNLSECNCCNRRINTTNPKNRLRILSSEWRIVLLCNNCYNSIKSSQICSYCLSRVSIWGIESVFDCRMCNRRIHTDCVAKFGVNRGNGDDISVCFDCWVPDLMLNDYIRHRKVRSKRKIRLCDDLAELESYRVFDSPDKGKSVEITGNNGDILDDNRVAAKSVFGKKAVELVDDNGGTHEGGLVVEDDAKLAIRLHRAMNSSPRIARNSLMLDKSSNHVPMAEARADVDVGECVNGVSSNVSLFGEESGLCMAESGQDCMQTSGGMQEEKWNGDSNGCLITYSRKRHASLARSFKEKRDKCVFKMYAESTQDCAQTNGGMQEEKWKGDSNGCLITYSRKKHASLVRSFKEKRDKCVFKMYAESSQDCVQTNGGMQEEKWNGDANGCLITYSRKRHASLARSFKEKRDKCVFKMYSRRPRVETNNTGCEHQLKTYRRRPYATKHCKQRLEFGGLDFKNEVLKLAVSVDCCEESKAVSTTTS